MAMRRVWMLGAYLWWNSDGARNEFSYWAKTEHKPQWTIMVQDRDDDHLELY